jgi:hypothetical protein
MYELDSRKDQLMTALKVAVVDVAMWARDHVLPASYAHAIWWRLMPLLSAAWAPRVRSGVG